MYTIHNDSRIKEITLFASSSFDVAIVIPTAMFCLLHYSSFNPSAWEPLTDPLICMLHPMHFHDTLVQNDLRTCCYLCVVKCTSQMLAYPVPCYPTSKVIILSVAKFGPLCSFICSIKSVLGFGTINYTCCFITFKWRWMFECTPEEILHKF